MSKPQITSPRCISISEVLSALERLAPCTMKTSVLQGDLRATARTSAQATLAASGKGNRKPVKAKQKPNQLETHYGRVMEGL